MGVSGSRAAVDINLDEFERRLRAAGSQPMGADDPLAELARLVESSRPAASAVPAPRRIEPVAPPSQEKGTLRPAFDVDAPDSSESLEEPVQIEEAAGGGEEAYPVAAAPPARGSFRRKLAVSSLAVLGVAMIGAVVAIKGHVPGLPKAAPFIAAAQGPTKVQPPSDETVSTSTDPGANLLKDNTQPGKVKLVSSEEQPVDLNAQTAPGPSEASSTASGATPVRSTVDTPVVVMAPPAPPPAAAPQFPDPKPVRTVSLRPDGTPIPAATTVADASGAVPEQPAPEPAKPVKPAPKAAADVGAGAQSSTPKIDLPTKISPKSSARVVVAKTDTTAPAAGADAPADLKAEKPAKATKQAKAEPVEPAVDSTVATASGGWAVQLAAPKTEAEANSAVARLNAKYGSALNGSTIGVHKASVHGETIYRLRVVGLTKADAAALCGRVKDDGGDCFIAK
jgi:hypothetical protein